MLYFLKIGGKKKLEVMHNNRAEDIHVMYRTFEEKAILKLSMKQYRIMYLRRGKKVVIEIIKHSIQDVDILLFTGVQVYDRGVCCLTVPWYLNDIEHFRKKCPGRLSLRRMGDDV